MSGNMSKVAAMSTEQRFCDYCKQNVSRSCFGKQKCRNGNFQDLKYWIKIQSKHQQSKENNSS